MVNILELELKFGNKDQLLVAIGKTNPQAKKPYMSSLTFFLSGKSCWVLVYSALFLLLFSRNPIWPGSIPDGWELEWENNDEEWYAWMASHVYPVFSFYFRCLNFDHLYFYVRKPGL
jgi:hypothetical protein